MKKLRPLLAGLLFAAPLAMAAPRMISFEYPNCYSCHVAVQGRGLLNARGRGIDIEQSYSELDATAALLGALVNPEFNDGSWDGNFGPVLADFVATGRYTHLLDGSKDDNTLAALYRQIIFFGSDKKVRINTELGFRDSGLNDLQLGPSITALGGDPFFLKKLTLDWRFHSKTGGGSELSIGRDYLPLGLQIDDPSAYILSLNRNGVYDYPLQAKYFMWRRKWLAAITAFAPSFDEQICSTREYGAGTMFEYSPNDKLVIGIQSLAGFAEQADRYRVGPYVRWGLSKKWTLLAETDFTHFSGTNASHDSGNQITSFLQLFYHHREWLVSSLTLNHAHSELLYAGKELFSGRYLLSARISRNLTFGLTFTAGDSQRNLSDGNEAGLFAAIKF